MGFGIGGLVALAVLFLGVVMLSNVGLRGMRIDLTQNRLYTLSPGTQQVLSELKEPVNLYFYFSREAAAKQAPLVMPYATRVREFLEELSARAGGKIHLRIVDPQPFSDEEDRAAEYGLQSLQAHAEVERLRLVKRERIQPARQERRRRDHDGGYRRERGNLAPVRAAERAHRPEGEIAQLPVVAHISEDANERAR